MNGRGDDGVEDTMIYFEMDPIFAEIRVRLRSFGPAYISHDSLANSTVFPFWHSRMI
jgi:hypothetical protein